MEFSLAEACVILACCCLLGVSANGQSKELLNVYVLGTVQGVLLVRVNEKKSCSQGSFNVVGVSG